MATFTPTRGVNFDPSAPAPSQAFGNPGPLERGLRSALTGAAADAAAREYYEASAAGDAARAQAAGLRHQNYSQQAQVEAPRVQSVGQVNGVGDAVQYGLGMLGSAPVSIVEPAAGGAIGGLAAAAIGSRFGLRPQLAGRMVQGGGAAGAVAPMYGQFRDAAATEHYQHELQTGQRQDPNEVLSTIQERGLAQAAPYLLSPMATAPGRIAAGRSILPQRSSQLGSAVQGMAVGAGADVASTVIGQSYRDTMDPTRNRSGDMTEIADEVIGGAIVGAPFEAAGQIGQGVQRAAGAAGGMALRGGQAVAEYIAPRATEAWQNRPRSMEQAAEMAGTFAAEMQNRGEDAATVLAAKRFTQDADVDTLLRSQDDIGADVEALKQDDVAKHAAAQSFLSKLADGTHDAPDYVHAAAAEYIRGTQSQDSWKQLSDAVNDWQRSKYLEQDLNELFKGKWESGMQKVGELGGDLMNAKDAAKDAYEVTRHDAGRMNAQTPRTDGGWGAGLGSVSGQNEFEFGKEFELPPLTTTGLESNPERQALAEMRASQTPGGILRSPSDRPPAEGEGLGARPSPYTAQDIEHGNARNVPKKTDEVFRRLLVDAIVPGLGLRTAGARANVGPVVAEGLQQWVQGGFSDHTGAVSAPRALLRLLPFEPVQTIAKVTDLMYRQGLIDNGVYARRNEALQKLQREIDLTGTVSTIVGERLLPTALVQLTPTEKRDLIDKLIEGRLSDSKAAAAFGNRYAEVQQDLQRIGIRSEMDYEDQLADLRLGGEDSDARTRTQLDSDKPVAEAGHEELAGMTDPFTPNEVATDSKWHHYNDYAGTPYEVGGRVLDPKNTDPETGEIPDKGSHEDRADAKIAELKAKNPGSSYEKVPYLDALVQRYGMSDEGLQATSDAISKLAAKHGYMSNEEIDRRFFVLRESTARGGEATDVSADSFKVVDPRDKRKNVWAEHVERSAEGDIIGGTAAEGKIWLRTADGREFATSTAKIITHISKGTRREQGNAGDGRATGTAGQVDMLHQGLASMFAAEADGKAALAPVIGFRKNNVSPIKWGGMDAKIPDELRMYTKTGATYGDAKRLGLDERARELSTALRKHISAASPRIKKEINAVLKASNAAVSDAERKSSLRELERLVGNFDKGTEEGKLKYADERQTVEPGAEIKGSRSLHEDRGEKARTNEDHTGETIGAGRSTPSNARKAAAENVAAEKQGLPRGKLQLPGELEAAKKAEDLKKPQFLLDVLRKGIPAFGDLLARATDAQRASILQTVLMMQEVSRQEAAAQHDIWGGNPPKDMAAFRVRLQNAINAVQGFALVNKGEIAKNPVMFDRKGKMVETTTPVETKVGENSTPTFAMNYKDGQVVHSTTLRMRPEFAGKDTMDLILSGDRTATTGSLGRFNGVKKGDVVMAQGNGKQALIRFTSDPYKVERGNNEAWSKLEGWAPDVMNEYVGQYQATYELVGQSDGAKYNAQSPVGRVSEAKYNAMATKLHTDLGRDGFGATHDSPIRHEGKFDWRSHQGKGEGNASFGAGTYLSTSDGVHRSYKDQFTAKTQRENGGEFSATINGKRINFGLDDEGAPDFFGHKDLNHAEMGVLEWMVMENMSVSEAVQSYIYDQNKIVEKFAESSLEGFPSPEVAALIRAHKPVPKDLALAEKSLVLSRWNRRLEQTAENIAAVKDIDQKSVKLASAIDSKSPTYEVSVDIKPEQLLDWDKPLSEQSELVRKAIGPQGKIIWGDKFSGGQHFTVEGVEYSVKEIAPGKWAANEPWGASSQAVYGNSLEAAANAIASPPGNVTYSRLARKLGSQAKASDYLQSIGILGHKYAASGGKNETHPNYVIYDDSKITTNYVHFNAQSAQAPTGSDPWTNAQRVQFFTDINRRLGPKIKSVLTDKLFGVDKNGKQFPISGQFLDDTITASIYATNVLQIGAHESMHALFKRLTAPGANAHRVTDLLLRAANSAPVVRQLERLLDGETNALKQIQAGAKDYAEERLAYMFQFHQAGLLKIGPETKTTFQKITDTLRAVFGVLSSDQKAERLLKAFDQGKMPDADAAMRVLERNLEWRENQYKAAGRLLSPVTNKLHRLVGTTEMNMKRHGVREYDEVVRLFKRAVGENGAQGFFDAKDQQTKIFTNKLANVFNGLEVKDLELAAKYLHSGEKPTDKVAKDVVAKVKGGTDGSGTKHKGILPELYEYMQSKGVMVWEASESDPKKGEWVPVRQVSNYFPRVYDMEKLSTKGADFVAALLKHNGKELEAIAAETEGRTAEEVAQAILARLTNSMGEPTLEETSSAVGFSPFAAAVNRRKLDWLSPEVIKEFGEKDVARVMTAYIVQAVKRAEYTERFGPDGSVLKNKLEAGHRTHFSNELGTKSGVDKAKLVDAMRDAAKREEPESEAAWALVESKMSRKDFDAAYKRSLQVARETATDVMAMEGTLGYDVRPMVRKLNNAAVVYQNLRTLSTSIFSQVVDPMGMVARGAEMSDAWTAYKRGLREVGASFKNENIKDKDAWIAEVVGTVDATNMLAQYGQLYGSQYMGGPFRRMNEAMFKYNGMEGFNRGMQIAGTRAAVNFIKRHSQFRSPKGDEYLAELNLKPGDVKVAESGDLNYTDPKIAAAIHQWVNGAVLRPNASQRTAWGSDPNYMAFWHMKQFAYTFHDTILKRVVHDAKKYGDAGPAAMLVATTIPLMIGTDAMKSILLTGDEPAWMNQGLDAQLHHGLVRSGLAGMYQPGLDAIDGAGGITGLAGPMVEQITSIPEKSFTENVVNALPGANIWNRHVEPAAP